MQYSVDIGRALGAAFFFEATGHQHTESGIAPFGLVVPAVRPPILMVCAMDE